MAYELIVNGRRHTIDVHPMRPLSRVLRDDLGLIGTKVGCGEGRCGSCTVILDGQAVTACLVPIGLADGGAIRTVEGLAAPDGPLSPLQEAMLEAGGVQCGICTPGVLMSLTAFLEGHPSPSEAEVREALSGNLCRCTGYHKIVEAALAAAGRM